MGWLSFWKSEDKRDRGLTLLRAVRTYMPDATDEDVKIVAAITGLLGQVAYVDRPYHASEEERIRRELGTVSGLHAGGADAICQTLRASIAAISEIEAHEYAKLVRDLGDHDLRLHVLDLLLDVAAADETVSVIEVNLIRRLTDVLGLTQSEYNASQARYRDRLSSLAPPKPPEGAGG